MELRCRLAKYPFFLIWNYRDNDDDNGRNECANGDVDAVRVVQMQRQWRLEFQFAAAESVVADRSSDPFVVLGFVTVRHQIWVNSIISPYHHAFHVVSRVTESSKYKRSGGGGVLYLSSVSQSNCFFFVFVPTTTNIQEIARVFCLAGPSVEVTMRL